MFDVLSDGFTNTLMLAGAAAFVTWALAIPLGVLAAVQQHSWIDRDAVVRRLHLAVDSGNSCGACCC